MSLRAVRFVLLLLATSAALGCSDPTADPPLPDAGPDADLPGVDPALLADCAEAEPTLCMCEVTSCGAAGTCVDVANGALCVCGVGYAGNNCDACAVGFASVAGETTCHQELTETQDEPDGDNCTYGGVRVAGGLDLDDDGVLEPEEIDDTHFVCNDSVPCVGDLCECPVDYCGASGACVVTTLGARCICETGYAGELCELCDEGYYLDGVTSACAPVQTLMIEQPEPRGDNCAAGGTALLVGEDANGDGVLQGPEVTYTSYDCRPSVVRTGNITVANLAQLNDLLGVTEIQGNLSMTAPFVTDLAPLASLAEVTGTVGITGASLVSLDGLETLEAVGALSISNAPALADISALDGLRVSGTITIQNNESLPEIAGFPLLERVNGDVIVRNNASLTSISGFPSLETIQRDLIVDNHPALVAVTGFSSLVGVNGKFELTNTSLLSDVSGWSALQATGSSFTVELCGALTSLDDFASITEIGGPFTVRGNGALAQMDGLDTLRWVGGDLEISGNSGLGSVDGLNGLVQVGIFVSGGYSMPRDMVIADNPSLTSIGGFGTFVRTTGGVRVANNDALPNLAGFSALATADWIRISDNALLSTIGGFGAMNAGAPSSTTPLRFLEVVDNPVLTHLEGFESLEVIESGFSLVGAGPMTTIEGLSSLRRVGGWLVIQDNASLTTLTGLDLDDVTTVEIQGNAALTDVDLLATGIGDDAQGLYLGDNDSLDDLSGLSNLDTVTDLMVEGNDALTSFAGVGALQVVHYLVIADNVSLGSLDGIESMTLGPSGLSQYPSIDVRGNPALTNISSIGGLGSPYQVRISNNDALTTLTGADGLTGVARLVIEDNDGLLDLVGSPVSSGATGSYVRIRNNAALVDISGLSVPPDPGTGVRRILTLTIEGNPSLVGMGLPADLTHVNTLDFVNNGSTSLVGSSGVEVANLYVENNSALVTIGELPQLLNNANFYLTNNDALIDVNGATNATDLNTLDIRENGALVDLAGFDGLVGAATAAAAPVQNLNVINNVSYPQCQVTTVFPYLAGNYVARYRNVYGNDAVAVCP